MGYQTLGFILFSFVTVFFYYTIGKKHQSMVLLIANIIFYCISGLQYLPFLLITMITTFLMAKKMRAIYMAADQELEQCEDRKQKKAIRLESRAKAKKYLKIGMWITIGLLVICKYTTFIVTNLNGLLQFFHITPLPLFDMILPVGISFYTFMALGYILDVYWRRYEAETSFIEYAVFLSYFPHVVQGPIDRYNKFMTQRKKVIPFQYDQFIKGIELMIWGFFKKLVIADRLGLYVDTVFNDYTSYASILLIFTICIYSIQIYADFSGCIDIVTGVSEMFGIELHKNFNHPYFSKTMGEFWRRWHMSLMEWFKDYIYFPVSTSNFVRTRKKALKQKGHKEASKHFASCFPIFVVWCVTGLWHGAAWQFAAWGMFHAAVLIGSNILESTFNTISERIHLDRTNFGWHLIQMIRTFIICGIGRVFFRSASLPDAIQYFSCSIQRINYTSLFKTGYVIGMSYSSFLIAVASVIVLWYVDMMQEKMCIRDCLAKQNIIFRWTIFFIGLFAIILWGIYGPGFDASSFIYEKF